MELSQLDASDDLATLTAILEAETGVPQDSQVLLYNQRPLVAGQTLEEQGVEPGSLIMLVKRQQPSATQSMAGSSIGGPGGASRAASAGPAPLRAFLNPDGSAADPGALMRVLTTTPGMLDQVPPGLADAARAGDTAKFQAALRELAAARRAAAEEEARFLRLAAEDPLNPEVQTRLEEAIRQRNVVENFEAAMEHNPEAFGTVTMLYVNMEVNGVPLKAFVDSGAQMTIMSKACAERCGLLRLLDKRWQGTAVGVGSATILGA